jgi:hypothetical protein
MIKRLPHNKLIWTVLCAVWLAALAPSVSAWLQARGRVATEVCSTSGPRVVVLNLQGHDIPAALLHAKHCPYCHLQQDLMMPPSASVTWRPVLAPDQRLSWSFVVKAYAGAAWLSRPSRAPPLSLV